MLVRFAPTALLLGPIITAVALLLQRRNRAAANALMDGSSQNVGRACKGERMSATNKCWARERL